MCTQYFSHSPYIGVSPAETSLKLDVSTEVSSMVTEQQRGTSPVNSVVVDYHREAQLIRDELETVDPKTFWLSLKEMCQKTARECPVVGVLVVGETGTGKSTLINNLMGKDVVEVGNLFESQTTRISKHSMDAEGIPVAFYDTPGLGDSRGVQDDKYLRMIEGILKSDEVHLVVYCMKLSETRMRDSLICTLQEYNKIGVKWERTVIALTFSDVVPVPKEVKKMPGFKKDHFFNDRVAKLRAHISRTLVERVGVTREVASRIKCHPTADPDVVLLNGERWFVPFLRNILELCTIPG